MAVVALSRKRIGEVNGRQNDEKFYRKKGTEACPGRKKETSAPIYAQPPVEKLAPEERDGAKAAGVGA